MYDTHLKSSLYFEDLPFVLSIVIDFQDTSPSRHAEMSLSSALPASTTSFQSLPSQTSVKQKRPAPDDLDQEQRITKRLHLLDLADSNNLLWLPANGVEAPTNTSAFPVATAPSALSSTPSIPVQAHDFMEVEDTAHKVWIHDLDAELASLGDGADGLNADGVVFIPDIEKKLNKIPRHVLTGRRDEDEIDVRLLEGAGQLILYNVPASLTVPEELDGVRKAIIESRARAREKSIRQREMNGRLHQEMAVSVQLKDDDEMDTDMDV